MIAALTPAAAALMVACAEIVPVGTLAYKLTPSLRDRAPAWRVALPLAVGAAILPVVVIFVHRGGGQFISRGSFLKNLSWDNLAAVICMASMTLSLLVFRAVRPDVGLWGPAGSRSVRGVGFVLFGGAMVGVLITYLLDKALAGPW